MKTLILTFLFFSSSLLIGSMSAGAHPMVEVKKLQSEVEALNRACARGLCREPYEKVELTQLSEVDLARFTNLASDLAQVWGDTILEGDYYAEGNTKVDTVTALLKNGQVFAYQVHYFERAWFTGNCVYDPKNIETLNNCELGKISESSYVSADFKIYYRDPTHFVEFESANP